MAIRWGVCTQNPCMHVKRNKETPRDRYVTDEELNAVMQISTPIIRLITICSLLTGQRISDVLKVSYDDIENGCVWVEQNKTKKRLLISISSELQKCFDEATKIRHDVKSSYVFCNQKGNKYTGSGFSTLWQRTMNKAIEDKIINERFTFHDIRAKTSSDINDLQRASELLGHSTTGNYQARLSS